MRPNTVRLFFFSNGETNDGLCGCSKTFVAFQKKVAQNACLTACRHIADILMDLLLSDDVKSISMGALQQVNLDVIQCERKSNSFYFFVLRQCIDFEIDRICRLGTRSRFRRRDVTLVLFGPAPTAGFVVVLGLVSLFPRLWPGDEQVSARVPPTSYNRLGKVRGVVTLIESTIFYRRLFCR